MRRSLALWPMTPLSHSTGSLSSNGSPVREYDSVASSFPSTRKLTQGNECVAGSVSREKRDRDLNSVRTLSDRQHFHDYLERKAELTVRGEVTCAVARVGLRRNASLCLFSCVHSMRLARVSFLSFAIDGRLLRFQPGLASRSGSLRFVATSFSQHSDETGDCEVGTSACGRDCRQVCCDTCFFRRD